MCAITQSLPLHLVIGAAFSGHSQRVRARFAAAVGSVLGQDVSSRSLGLLRVFAALSIWVEFASPWVMHRMDDLFGTWALALLVLVPAWFVIFGLGTRVAAIIMASAFAGLHLYYGVHLGIEKLIYPVREFQVAVLLALTPCNRSLSVDRILALRRARREQRPTPPERVPWWVVELFILQLATTFLWWGIDGLTPEWRDGSALEVEFLRLYGSADTFVAHPSFHAIMLGVAWATTILNFVLALGLLIRPLRRYLVWVAFAYLFVAMLALSRTYANSYEYLIMMTLLIACLPPTWVHELTTHQLGPKPARAP